jgi:hypothetical protein
LLWLGFALLGLVLVLIFVRDHSSPNKKDKRGALKLLASEVTTPETKPVETPETRATCITANEVSVPMFFQSSKQVKNHCSLDMSHLMAEKVNFKCRTQVQDFSNKNLDMDQWRKDCGINPLEEKTKIVLEPCYTAKKVKIPLFFHSSLAEPFHCSWDSTHPMAIKVDPLCRKRVQDFSDPDMDLEQWKTKCGMENFREILGPLDAWKSNVSKTWVRELVSLLQQTPSYFDEKSGGIAVWHGCNLKGRNSSRKAADYMFYAPVNVKAESLGIFAFLAWIKVKDAYTAPVEIGIFCDVPLFLVPYLKNLDPALHVHNVSSSEKFQENAMTGGGNVISVTDEKMDRAFWKLVWAVRLVQQKKPMDSMKPPLFAFSPLFTQRAVPDEQNAFFAALEKNDGSFTSTDSEKLLYTVVPKNDELYSANMKSLANDVSLLLSENIHHELYLLITQGECAKTRQTFFSKKENCVFVPQPFSFE